MTDKMFIAEEAAIPLNVQVQSDMFAHVASGGEDTTAEWIVHALSKSAGVAAFFGVTGGLIWAFFG